MRATMPYLRALLGIAFFCCVAWLLSSRRDRFPWRVVLGGVGLQIAIAILLLGTGVGRGTFQALARGFGAVIERTAPGARLVFGPLADPAEMGRVFGAEGAFVFAFAGTGLLVILSVSALMGLLYHLGVMQALIWVLAKVMTRVLGVSGAESMAMAANVFAGQTEAPLVVKPYIAGMTMSELNALMTGGFATIAGSVLAVYMGILGPELGPHLLTASVMSAPAAFVVAKIVRPEVDEPVTGRHVELRIEREGVNVIESVANGISDGLKLYLNVIAMLIGFLFLVNLIDWPLGAAGLSLSRIFGWVFAPVAWMMGVEGWHDSQLMGSLLGTKLAINEFIGFQQLAGYASGAPGSALTFQHARTAGMGAYALCGFANLASIGIQIGGITPLAPARRADLARLAVRAMLGGAFASWMTASIAGAFLSA